MTLFHVGLHVSDLARSVAFYRSLLGTDPIKHFEDYARFESDRPPVIVALYPSPQQPGGTLNHVGLRLSSSAELVEIQHRLEAVGIATQRQNGVECCYSRQTKFWVTDPDRTLWEIYTLEGDIVHSGFDDSPRKAAPIEATWQHRLTEPIPASIPFPDASLDAVRFEGTFNANVSSEHLASLLTDALRVLKPGGELVVHGLVGDKSLLGEPKLPGLASLVQRVPIQAELVESLVDAGFRGLMFHKLDDIHASTVNGLELREMQLMGWKPGVSTSHIVMYKGPFDQVTDDTGTVYTRGVPIELPGKVAKSLFAGPTAGAFASLAK